MAESEEQELEDQLNASIAETLVARRERDRALTALERLVEAIEWTIDDGGANLERELDALNEARSLLGRAS